MNREKIETFVERNTQTSLQEACGLLRAILADGDDDTPHYQEVCAFLGHEVVYDIDEDLASCACGERKLTGAELRRVEP